MSELVIVALPEDAHPHAFSTMEALIRHALSCPDPGRPSDALDTSQIRARYVRVEPAPREVASLAVSARWVSKRELTVLARRIVTELGAGRVAVLHVDADEVWGGPRRSRNSPGCAARSPTVALTRRTSW
ncbi:MAG: hypothetical protein ABMB14_16895 [Myxococcota bacterium]